MVLATDLLCIVNLLDKHQMKVTLNRIVIHITCYKVFAIYFR